MPQCSHLFSFFSLHFLVILSDSENALFFAEKNVEDSIFRYFLFSTICTYFQLLYYYLLNIEEANIESESRQFNSI